jgi:hypothetical protein
MTPFPAVAILIGANQIGSEIMADFEVFPIIAKDDYPTFRQIIGDDIPATYDEWLKLQTKEIREFNQAGRNTKKVPVDPYEFSRFLTARGANANIVSLRNFTIEKDAGNPRLYCVSAVHRGFSQLLISPRFSTGAQCLPVLSV